MTEKRNMTGRYRLKMRRTRATRYTPAWRERVPYHPYCMERYMEAARAIPPKNTTTGYMISKSLVRTGVNSFWMSSRPSPAVMTCSDFVMLQNLPTVASPSPRCQVGTRPRSISITDSFPRPLCQRQPKMDLPAGGSAAACGHLRNSEGLDEPR